MDIPVSAVYACFDGFYVFLGYYPMIRPAIEKLGVLAKPVKLLLFTLAGAASYGMLLVVMGAPAAMGEGWLPRGGTLFLSPSLLGRYAVTDT